MTNGYANIFGRGKVLLTGEYAVLYGAQALAFPSYKGQSLTLSLTSAQNQLEWTSIDTDNIWFSACYDTISMDILEASDHDIALRLQEILLATRRLNARFLPAQQGWKAETRSDFPRAWGLGTSSTLIYLVSSWAGVNPFTLLRMTLGGSGYDIACAGSSAPILYKIENNEACFEEVVFNPPFLESLYLVYSGKKMSSAREIQRMSGIGSIPAPLLHDISMISQGVLKSTSLNEFRQLLMEHERIIGRIIDKTPVKDHCFADYPDQVKSLGAWGGDLLLFVWEDTIDGFKRYLDTKGLRTVMPFTELLITS